MKARVVDPLIGIIAEDPGELSIFLDSAGIIVTAAFTGESARMEEETAARGRKPKRPRGAHELPGGGWWWWCACFFLRRFVNGNEERALLNEGVNPL